LPTNPRPASRAALDRHRCASQPISPTRVAARRLLRRSAPCRPNNHDCATGRPTAAVGCFADLLRVIGRPMPAALGSLSPIRATSAGHDRHGGRSVASASVLNATVSLYSQVLIKFGNASLLNPADLTLQQRLTNRRLSPLGQHSQLPSAHFTDKETRRVIGRICYFFAGSATSCNQQTYKWIRLLGLHNIKYKIRLAMCMLLTRMMHSLHANFAHVFLSYALLQIYIFF
jgi:hypothetical protein